jgi:hypothetical protein
MSRFNLMDTSREEMGIFGVTTPWPKPLHNEISYPRNALEDDATLFTCNDGIEAAYGIIDSILQSWETGGILTLTSYQPCSWGPEKADQLLVKVGRERRYSCAEHV